MVYCSVLCCSILDWIGPKCRLIVLIIFSTIDAICTTPDARISAYHMSTCYLFFKGASSTLLTLMEPQMCSFSTHQLEGEW